MIRFFIHVDLVLLIFLKRDYEQVTSPYSMHILSFLNILITHFQRTEPASQTALKYQT